MEMDKAIDMYSILCLHYTILGPYTKMFEIMKLNKCIEGEIMGLYRK